MKLPSGTILGPYEDRESWLQARKTGLGGSDIAAILGLENFTSALEVFYDKTSDYSRDLGARGHFMEWGNILEPVILKQWADERGLSYTTSKFLVQSDTLPFLISSPDSFILKGEPIEGAEIKNVRSDYNWDPYPERIYAQIQHYLLVTGLPLWHLVALVAGNKLIHHEILPDKEFQGRIALAAEKFWTEHVLTGIPPEPDGSESASKALSAHWTETTPESPVELEEGLWSDYREVCNDLKVCELTRDQLEQKIKAQMEDKEAAVVDGETVATWKLQTRKSLDIKRLRQDNPSMAEKYQKVSTNRVFRPKL